MYKINELLDIFVDDSFDLNNSGTEDIIRKIAEFYKDDYRHQYHEISRYVNDKIEWEKDELEFALNNIHNLIIYLQLAPDKYESILQDIDKKHTCKKIVRSLEKLYDHFALEEERIIKNKQIIEESKDDIRSDVMFQFEEIGDQFRKKTEEVSNSLNNNIITVVGLFSAIIFVFFGGITGMASVIKGIFDLKTKNDLTLPILVLLLIGFVIFNTIFLLLYSIAKIVDKNIGLIISLPERYYFIEENDNGCYEVTNDESRVLKCFKYEKDALKYLNRKNAIFSVWRGIIAIIKRIFFRYPYMIFINLFFIVSMLYLYNKI